MQEINEIIIKKLNNYPSTTREMAKSALKLAERGFSDASIAEQLSSIVRKLARVGVNKNDTT